MISQTEGIVLAQVMNSGNASCVVHLLQRCKDEPFRIAVGMIDKLVSLFEASFWMSKRHSYIPIQVFILFCSKVASVMNTACRRIYVLQVLRQDFGETQRSSAERLIRLAKDSKGWP